jgi:hypothetical protein
VSAPREHDPDAHTRGTHHFLVSSDDLLEGDAVLLRERLTLRRERAACGEKVTSFVPHGLTGYRRMTWCCILQHENDLVFYTKAASRT